MNKILKSSNFWHIYKLFLLLSKKRKYQLIAVIVFMVLAAFSEIFSLVSFIPFVTSLSEPEIILKSKVISNYFPFLINLSLSNFVLISTLIFCSSVILAAAFRILNIYLTFRITAFIGTDLMKGCLKKVYGQTYSEFISRNSSETVHLSVIQVKDAINVINYTLQLITSLILFIFLLLTMYFINKQLTLISVSFFTSIYILIILKFKSKLYRYGKENDKLKNQQLQLVTEINGSIRDLLITNSQKKFIDIILNKDLQIRRKEAEAFFLNSFPKPAIEASALFLFGMFGAILFSLSPNNSSIPTLAAIALASQKLLPSLQNIYACWATINSFISGTKSVNSFLSLPSTNLNKNFKSVNNFSKWKNLRFVNISYKRNKSEKEILHNISLDIKRGEIIGIKGVTGSGKSTFIDLLMGLLKPNEGSISLYNNEKYTAEIFNNPYWFSQISHVPQKIYLLDTTIAQNIAFTFDDEEIDKSRLVEASKLAQIDNYINKLKEGYNTTVGDQGINLSGGQQQRIAIARALYRQSSILILDEATSSLDYKTEELIMDSISNLARDSGLTVVIIAHRLKTLKKCNNVYQIDQGKLIKTVNYY